MIGFDGKVVVVTGAGNGLGKAHALEFARRGASVVVNDVGCAVDGTGASRAAAEAVAEEIRSLGAYAVASCHSVASPEGGEAVVACALKQFGRVDAVVINAGILVNVAFHEMDGEQLQRVISTNLMGAIYVAQPAYKAMRDQKYGRIVFTSSAAGLFGARNGANYAAAKAGMMGLSSTIAIEGADFGIKSNILAPGANTRMATAIRPEDVGADIVARLSALPSKPVSLGSEFVTPMVVYLASERCTVTGRMFSAANGRFARAFIGVTAGWYGPSAVPAAPEDIERRLSAIEDRSDYHIPTSAYDEMAIVTTNAPPR